MFLRMSSAVASPFSRARNSSRVSVSFSSRISAISSILARFSVRICRAALIAEVDKGADLLVDGAGHVLAVVAVLHQVAAKERVAVPAAESHMPSRSLMPYSQTMARARSVARSRSLTAPVVTSPKTISSATRPPSRDGDVVQHILLGAETLLFRQVPGRAAAIPRGMIVTL